MSSPTLVSVYEYLGTNYRPDCDHIDGQVLERNVGEYDHSRLQLRLGSYLLVNYELLGFEVVTEQRVQFEPSRFRVPDITVLRGEPREQIITHPPFLCVEILSPEDSMSSMQERIDDYLKFGVENVWVLDPRRKKSFWADASGIYESVGGILEASGGSVRADLTNPWPK